MTEWFSEQSRYFKFGVLCTVLAVLYILFAPTERPPQYYERNNTWDPQQTTVAMEPISMNGYELKPLHKFVVQARVLGAERYRVGREADLSPLDLALGWGPMADTETLNEISISQSGRFYFWRVQEFPIPRKDIERNSANMHLIPSSDAVRDEMLKARKGDVVSFSGHLVSIKSEKDDWHWKSSTTRNDTGAGACEVIYVEEFEVL